MSDQQPLNDPAEWVDDVVVDRYLAGTASTIDRKLTRGEKRVIARRMHAEGVSPSRVSMDLGVNYRTVKKWLGLTTTEAPR